MNDLPRLIGLMLLAQPEPELPFEADDEDLPEIPGWRSIYAQQVCESDPQLCAPCDCTSHLSQL